MHEIDQTTEQMVRSVLAYAENRLRMDPVPLDIGTLPADELNARLAGLIRDSGRHPDEVLGVYSSVIAPSIISADSTRFLGFIPAAPTKASLLFDMLVSCASIQGISWLEASGAIAAENTVLRLIADEAGLPASAGGLLRLRRLGRQPVVPRRRSRDRQEEAGRGGPGPAAPRHRRHRRALLDREHPAAAGDGRTRGRHTRPPDDRGERARRDRGRARPVRRRGRGVHVGHHQRRHRRRPRGRGDAWRTSRAGGSTSTGRTAARGSSPGRSSRSTPASSSADSFILDPHKWLFTSVRLLRGALPGARARARRTHPGRVVPRRHPRLRRRVEPDRLRLPPDPPSPRAAVVVLARGLRRRWGGGSPHASRCGASAPGSPGRRTANGRSRLSFAR